MDQEKFDPPKSNFIVQVTRCVVQVEPRVSIRTCLLSITHEFIFHHVFVFKHISNWVLNGPRKRNVLKFLELVRSIRSKLVTVSEINQKVTLLAGLKGVVVNWLKNSMKTLNFTLLVLNIKKCMFFGNRLFFFLFQYYRWNDRGVTCLKDYEYRLNIVHLW